YLVRVKFYANLSEKDTKCIMETITELGNATEFPEIPQSAKEHGVDTIDYIVVEVFKKVG
ncbi:MAG: hypothetical protein KKB59_20075, partial [Spirochaetes bacterium]|nr:hypothetical protein [Spirochaetota bacterium]